MAAFVLDPYQVLSFSAAFVTAFFAVFVARRSFLVMLVLAVVLFFLFGPLALPGFFLGVGAAFLARYFAGKGKDGKGEKTREGKKRRAKNR